MGRDGRQFTEAEEAALLAELQDFKRSHPRADTNDKLAGQIGISGSVLSELMRRKYKGDVQAKLRDIDNFLDKQRKSANRAELRDFASTSLVEKSYGVFNAAIKYNSMAAIVGDSGDGKTTIALGFAKDREDVKYVRIDEAHGDARGVTATFWQVFKMGIPRPHRERLREITAYLQKNHNLVLLIDEAQKLKADGMEVIRDMYDGSDADGRHNVPIIFFGDQDFYKLLVRARNGEPSPIKPQMTRRLYPVLNFEVDGCQGPDGALFTVDDVVKILGNRRLRIVTDEGVRWLASLANTRGYGSLGFAVVVARMGFEISSKGPITVDDLRLALQMVLGPRGSKLIDESAGGSLLRAVG